MDCGPPRVLLATESWESPFDRPDGGISGPAGFGTMDADDAGNDVFGGDGGGGSGSGNGGGGFASSGDEGGGESKQPRALPLDLPKSLDDRRRPTDLVPETELYDGWQGACPRAQGFPRPLRPLATFYYLLLTSPLP